MNIDVILAGLPDLDDDATVPTSPRANDLVAMDDAFESADYGLATAEDDASTFSKRDSSERRDARGRRWLAESGKWSAPGL